MELNATDRVVKTWFNGVGTQYGMGTLAAYDYLYFKQGNEENTAYYTIDETRSREIAFLNCHLFLSGEIYIEWYSPL